MIRRPPRSTLDRSSAASDVYKRQVLSLPVLLGGMPDLFPWTPAWLRSPWLLWLLTTPVQFWVGGQFHLAFLRELRHRSTSMNTLVSIGTSAAYFFSVAVILWPHAFM